MTKELDPAAGFSLVELLIAMLVTMLVSGAVFALMSAGQGAFRREPELTDRQQNIRLAMDLVQRDLATAGMGTGIWDQVFTTGLNSLNPLPNGPSGQRVDGLEVLGSTGECPEVPVSGYTQATRTITTLVPLPTCYVGSGPVAVVMSDNTTVYWGFAANNVNPGTTVVFNAAAAQPATASIATLLAGTTAPIRIARLQLVRYQVANDTDLVPSLWRSPTGGRNPATGAAAVPDGSAAATAAGWQIIARGIEDLQIRYVSPGVAAAADVPPVVANPTWGTMVQDVQVTLWARAQGVNLQGERAAAGQPNAVRGSLNSVTTPRAVLLNLRSAPGALQWQ